MSIGKRKVGGGGPARGGGVVGKVPLPKVSSASSKATETARKAAMKARVKKLARERELQAKKGVDMRSRVQGLARQRELEMKEVARVDKLFGL
jgi:hypothetical protein